MRVLGSVIVCLTNRYLRWGTPNFSSTVASLFSILELIRKENLKDTQVVTRSEFQRISIFLTQIPEILARQVLYLSLQISS
ncbi:hypothetical protein NSTCB13_02622 [Nostoc sp. DSM 114160]